MAARATTTPHVHVSSSKQAWAAVFFVAVVLGVVAALNAGILKNPIDIGIIITLTTVLVMIGHFLSVRHIISETALPLWYVLVFGVMLLIAGGISSGLIAPAFVVSGASILEISIANALLYTVIIAAAAALILVLLRMKRGTPLF